MCVGLGYDWTTLCMSSRANACLGTPRRVCNPPNVDLDGVFADV